jgi:hypothetical protein
MSAVLPMLRLLAGELPTLAEHAEAYAELAAEEAAAATRQWSLRAAAMAAALVAALLAVGLGGVALMLWATLPQQPAGPARWVLWALPSAFGLVAVLTAWAARGLPRPRAFAELRSQWRQDMALLRGDAAP